MPGLSSQNQLRKLCYDNTHLMNSLRIMRYKSKSRLWNDCIQASLVTLIYFNRFMMFFTTINVIFTTMNVFFVSFHRHRWQPSWNSYYMWLIGMACRRRSLWSSLYWPWLRWRLLQWSKCLHLPLISPEFTIFHVNIIINTVTIILTLHRNSWIMFSLVNKKKQIKNAINNN